MAPIDARFSSGSSRLWIFIGCLFLAGIIAGFLLAMWGAKNSPPDINLRVDGKNALTIKFPQYKKNETDTINDLMRRQTEKERERRQTVLAVLAANHQVYEFGQDELINRVGNETNTDYAKKFVELVVDGRGPFKNMQFYSLKDRKTAIAILNLNYDHKLIRGLRKKIIGGQTHLTPKSYNVEVIYSRDVPKRYAAVCQKSEYHRNRILLFQPENLIYLRVLGGFDLEHDMCNTAPNRVIQINSQYLMSSVEKGTESVEEKIVSEKEKCFPVKKVFQSGTRVIARAEIDGQFVEQKIQLQ